jgi:hypothetical protein
VNINVLNINALHAKEVAFVNITNAEHVVLNVVEVVYVNTKKKNVDASNVMAMNYVNTIYVRNTVLHVRVVPFANIN